jgi:hypothetical protein
LRDGGDCIDGLGVAMGDLRQVVGGGAMTSTLRAHNEGMGALRLGKEATRSLERAGIRIAVMDLVAFAVVDVVIACMDFAALVFA